MTLKQVTQEVASIIEELADAGRLKSGQVLVIGASTSEVLGKRIGTGGAEEVAAAIYEAVQRGRERIGYLPVFQCCEHLNRALVAEQEAVERFDWLEVAAVPVPKAGGAMAAYAYRHLPNAMLVESVQAPCGNRYWRHDDRDAFTKGGRTVSPFCEASRLCTCNSSL